MWSYIIAYANADERVYRKDNEKVENYREECKQSYTVIETLDQLKYYTNIVAKIIHVCILICRR